MRYVKIPRVNLKKRHFSTKFCKKNPSHKASNKFRLSRNYLNKRPQVVREQKFKIFGFVDRAEGSGGINDRKF